MTGNEKYRKPFEPLIGGVRFADYNDLESVKSQLTDKTCGIILETVQGEGGIYPATEEFLKGVQALCEEHDLVLILDEIQCGMGRTGSMFAWQEYGVMPDVMTCAKALGCGVPVGAFVLGKKVAETSLAPGDHGTTYGGNRSYAQRSARYLISMKKNRLWIMYRRDRDAYLEEKLNALVDKYDFLKERRGKGLIQGLGSGRKTGGRGCEPSTGAWTDHHHRRKQRASFCSAACDHQCRCR